MYWPAWIVAYDESVAKYKVCFGYDKVLTIGYFSGADDNEIIRFRGASDWETVLPHVRPKAKAVRKRKGQKLTPLQVTATQLKREATRATSVAAALRSELAAAMAAGKHDAATEAAAVAKLAAADAAAQAAAAKSADARAASEADRAAAAAAAEAEEAAKVAATRYIPKQSKSLQLAIERCEYDLSVFNTVADHRWAML